MVTYVTSPCSGLNGYTFPSATDYYVLIAVLSFIWLHCLGNSVIETGREPYHWRQPLKPKIKNFECHVHKAFSVLLNSHEDDLILVSLIVIH